MKRKIVLFILIVISIVISGCMNNESKSTQDNKTQTTQEKYRIAVISGSISEGFNPDYSKTTATYGWVQMITGNGGNGYPEPKTNNIYSLYENVELKNFSEHGITAGEWNNSTKLDAVYEFNPNIIIVYLGANDFFGALSSEGVFSEADKNKLEKNLSDIIEKLRLKFPTVEIIMPNYFDLMDGLSKKIDPNGAAKKFQNISEYISNINENIIKKIAVNNNCIYIDINSKFYGHCYGRFFNSGFVENSSYVYTINFPAEFDIHPNTKGHEVIYEEVYNILKNIK